ARRARPGDARASSATRAVAAHAADPTGRGRHQRSRSDGQASLLLRHRALLSRLRDPAAFPRRLEQTLRSSADRLDGRPSAAIASAPLPAIVPLVHRVTPAFLRLVVPVPATTDTPQR